MRGPAVHSHTLDNYAHIDSPLHRVPAAPKMLTAIGAIVALIVLPPSPFLFAVAGFLLILLGAASNIPGTFIVKRMLLLEPFVLGVAVLTLLGPDGGVVFLTIITRTSLCILIIILLANTTRFSDQLLVLRKIRVPSLMITTLALMHRYLYVLKDETERMKRARASRTFTRRSLRYKWASLATIIAQLFVRSSLRAERVYAAMCARGWR